MGSQFKKRRRIFPRVRIDLSQSGVLVDFDVRGMLVAVQNPGTATNGGWDAQLDERPATGTRIYRRSQPDALSSNNLVGLANLACEVEARRARITRALEACRRRKARVEFWLRIGRAPVFSSFFARPWVTAWRVALARMEKTEDNLIK